MTTSLFSDDRFRGYSLSDSRPAAFLDFAYDDPSGVYFGGSGSGILRQGRPEALGLEVNAGYAKSLNGETTVDVGITHSNYSRYSSTEGGNSSTELYAGVARRGLSARIYLSPHYFEAGRWTAYSEVDDTLSPARDWTFNAHIGMLVGLRSPEGEHYRTNVDWSAGVTRSLGRLSLHATWSDGLPGDDYYGSRRRSRSALVVGASFAL